MTYTFRPASRTEAKPLIGLYSESGAGKTYSALILARGFVGPKGKIGMIETESGRGEAYADPTEYPEIGGYDVLPLRETFSPQEYGKAIEAAEKAKLDALIIDSASHEWEGVGGVLSMAADNQANGKTGPIVWQKPKMDHARFFMLRFMQTSIPLVILCMRAKYPMEEVKANGKKQWRRATTLEPKQSDDILFEMFVHGWIERESHTFRLTKCTATGLEPVFADGKPITVETGAELAKWAKGSQQASKPKAEPKQETEEPKSTTADDPIYKEADRVASDGKDAFRAWWGNLGEADRKKLRPNLETYQGIAEGADQHKASKAEEDPFGLPLENADAV